MQIRIRLQELLEHYDLDEHGVIQKIADYLKLHRHTIRKLYNNQHSNPSLEVLGKVCDWLVHNDVPAETLPQALFGTGASGLRDKVAEAGAVTIYIGEYRQSVGNASIPWVSRRDASVAANLIRWLSTPGIRGLQELSFDMRYLPFEVDESSPPRSKDKPSIKKGLKRDYKIAQERYAQSTEELKHSSRVFVGSQRINRLVEMLVADLFGCTPFVTERRRTCVPFYLAYQNPLRPVESCFGGLTKPPGDEGRFIPGIHYLTPEKKWACVPWIENRQECGIVIVSTVRRIKGCTLAVMGLSGSGTEALGRFLRDRDNEKKFWPSYAEKGATKLGVYICKIAYESRPTDEPINPIRIKDVAVTPVDEKVLTAYMKAD
jgi:hypothetical protein